MTEAKQEEEKVTWW